MNLFAMNFYQVDWQSACLYLEILDRSRKHFAEHDLNVSLATHEFHESHIATVNYGLRQLLLVKHCGWEKCAVKRNLKDIVLSDNLVLFST